MRYRTTRRREPKRIRKRLASLVGEARRHGQEVVTFNVRETCNALDLKSARRYSYCCDVLDSEFFASSNHLGRYCRTGAWGTGDASYSFLLKPSQELRSRRRQRNRARALVGVCLLLGIICVIMSLAWLAVLLAVA